MADQGLESGFESTVFLELRGLHSPVAADCGGRTAETFRLDGTGADNTFTDDGTVFPVRRRNQFVFRECGDFHMQVDSVEQRARNSGSVLLNLKRAASADVMPVPEMPAGTRVHGRNQNEIRRKNETPGGAADGNRPVLQRLAQHFQNIALEFRQFIEEKHTVVREADFPRLRRSPSSKESCIADRMMRSAEGPGFQQRGIGIQKTENRMDFACFKRFLFRHRRKNPGQTLRQHAFPRSRRPHKKNIVSSRGGDFQCALCPALSLDVMKVRYGRPVRIPEDSARARLKRQTFPTKSGERLRQIGHRINTEVPGRHRRLSHVPGRHNQCPELLLRLEFSGRQSGGKHSANRTDRPVQRQFPQNQRLFQRPLRQRARGGNQAKRHRKIKTGPLLAEIGGSKIHQSRPFRMTIAAGKKSGTDPFTAFTHHRIRESHNGNDGLFPASGCIHFNFNRKRVNSHQGCGKGFCQHGTRSALCIIPKFIRER